MFRRTAVVFLALILAATVALAGQGPHRARLSADLEQHLASPAAPTVTVIVTGSRDEIEALAARHGLTPKRWLSEGAVLDVAAGEPAGAQPTTPPSRTSRATCPCAGRWR